MMRQRYAVIVLTCAQLGGACGPQSNAPTEVEFNRSALTTSWTGPWASGGATSGPIGINGNRPYWWLYAERSGAIDSIEGDGAGGSWNTGISSGTITNRPQLTNNWVSPAGSLYCSTIAWKNNSGTMSWQVEFMNLSSECVLNDAFDGPHTVSGTIDSAPAIVSYEFYFFFNYYQTYTAYARRASDGALMFSTYSDTGSDRAYGGTFSSWNVGSYGGSYSGTIKAGSSPAAIAAYPNDVRIFIRGTDDALYYISHTNGSFGSWVSLGIPFDARPPFSDVFVGSDPSAGTCNGEYYVCVTGTDGNVWCISTTSGNWGSWSNKAYPGNNQASGAPAVTGCTPDDEPWVYVRDTNSQMFARRF